MVFNFLSAARTPGDTEADSCWCVPPQDNFKKYGDGAGFVSVELAKSIVSAGPNSATNGQA